MDGPADGSVPSDLVPRRQPDTVTGAGPDYSIYASERVVGRVYCRVARRDFEQRFWGVNGVVTSSEIGQLHGFAESFDQARTRLRGAFNLWLAWALAAPPSHLSYATIRPARRWCAVLNPIVSAGADDGD
jgi:hypothetical protein